MKEAGLDLIDSLEDGSALKEKYTRESPMTEKSKVDETKEKIGGAKGEQASNFNTIMLGLNMAMPALQFMLQQLDKMREAQEQKEEAVKKIAAAVKIVNELKKQLKRMEEPGQASAGIGGGVK